MILELYSRLGTAWSWLSHQVPDLKTSSKPCWMGEEANEVTLRGTVLHRLALRTGVYELKKGGLGLTDLIA